MRKLTRYNKYFLLNVEARKENRQPCPVCGFPIGIVAGTKDAICTNCGFKDPCCE